MQRSLDSWCAGERDMAVLHAGIAVEHLLKAFMVDGRDFSSLLHAVGEGAYAPVDEHRSKSIGAAECFKRVAQFIPLPLTERQAEPIFNARNGVAHLGLHRADMTRDIVALAAQINDAVLDGLGGDRFEYWNPHAFRSEDRWTGPHDLDAARDRWSATQREQQEAQRTRDIREASVAARISYARKVFEVHGVASQFLSFRRFPEQQPLSVEAWLQSRPNDPRNYAQYCKDWFEEYRRKETRLEPVSATSSAC